MSSPTSPKTLETDLKLSTIGTKYDVGNKGFLTDAEKEMRARDVENIGHLSNAQVSAIVGETLSLRDKTDRLKIFVGILSCAVVTLALSNLGTAFAAAILAKDTQVDSSTGQLQAKGTGAPVTTQSMGNTESFELDAASLDGFFPYGCAEPHQVRSIWNSVLNGTATNLVIKKPLMESETDPTLQEFYSIDLNPSGLHYNETMACIPVSHPSIEVHLCFDFTNDRCYGIGESPQGRALEMEEPKTHHFRRQLFHSVVASQGELSRHRGLGINMMYEHKIFYLFYRGDILSSPNTTVDDDQQQSNTTTSDLEDANGSRNLNTCAAAGSWCGGWTGDNCCPHSESDKTNSCESEWLLFPGRCTTFQNNA